MQVVHVNTERAWRGGENQALLLMRGLRELGVDQRLVAQRGGAMAKRAFDAGFDVTEMPMGAGLDWVAPLHIGRMLREDPADILHAHTAHAHSICLKAKRRCGKRKPRIVVTRHVAYSIFRHSFMGLNRWKYNRADLIVCISNAVKKQLLEDGVSDDKLTVVHNGIETALFANPLDLSRTYRKEWKLPDDAFVLGNVGAHTPEKAQRNLLAAFARLYPAHPKLYCLFVGDGPERAALTAQAADAGCGDRVRFAGVRDDVPSLLAFFDLFCCPSISEGFSLAVLEAMASACPIVATRAGGIPELVRDNQEALLVEPGDVPELAIAIESLLNDPGGARGLGAAARSRATSRFGYRNTARLTLAAYGRLS